MNFGEKLIFTWILTFPFVFGYGMLEICHLKINIRNYILWIWVSILIFISLYAIWF